MTNCSTRKRHPEQPAQQPVMGQEAVQAKGMGSVVRRGGLNEDLKPDSQRVKVKIATGHGSRG
jgi:hypothetical protein